MKPIMQSSSSNDSLHLPEMERHFATENIDTRLLDKIFLKHPELRVKSLKETLMDTGELELDSTSGEADNSEGKVPVIMNDDENT